ncbi:sensor histidine kinase [Pseudactinotalea sp.]|uniref:sensor histidine kinase n=1 Tax=Pseudactinotalea sp. TaxID=1926260 RepID=UPI003B3AF896
MAEVRRAEHTAIRRYLLATAAVLLAVIGVTTGGAWWFARAEAREQARDVAQSFARTVAAPLRIADLHADREGGGSREALGAAVTALLDGDDVYRVKVWLLEDEHVEIVYSDELSIDGLRVPVSEVLAEALRTMSPVVTSVPDDDAHATEVTSPHQLLEVYVPFRDAGGEVAVAELYLITRVDERAVELVSHVLPLVVGGPVLLAAATMPLALRMARSHGRAERDRRQLVDQALAASEVERRRLAQRLHDGVIQDLAAIGMALEVETAQGGPVPVGLAERVRTEARQLRALLDELDPPGAVQGDLRSALAAAAAPGTAVTVSGAALERVEGRTRDLVHRAASELIRNAVRHASASEIVVELVDRAGCVGVRVRDDGVGFDPAVVPSGHHGLRLIRAAVTEAGGEYEVRSGSAGTTVEVRIPYR